MLIPFLISWCTYSTGVYCQLVKELVHGQLLCRGHRPEHPIAGRASQEQFRLRIVCVERESLIHHVLY